MVYKRGGEILKVGNRIIIALTSAMFFDRRRQTSNGADNQAIVRQYEDFQRLWNGRSKSILKQPLAGVPALAVVEPDDVLDELDEELVRLERQLQRWYMSDAEC